jgi:hypothetical protein
MLTLQPKQNNADHAFSRLPAAQGLYDPKNEKDNCGVGMIANLKKASSHRIVKNALQVRNTVRGLKLLVYGALSY